MRERRSRDVSALYLFFAAFLDFFDFPAFFALSVFFADAFGASLPALSAAMVVNDAVAKMAATSIVISLRMSVFLPMNC